MDSDGILFCLKNEMLKHPPFFFFFDYGLTYRPLTGFYFFIIVVRMVTAIMIFGYHSFYMHLLVQRIRVLAITKTLFGISLCKKKLLLKLQSL